MFPPLSVQHSWSLSDSEGHGPAWYKRVTKRLVQFCRRKRHKFSSKVAAKTKQTFHTVSNNGNDDGEPIGQDITYKALSLVIKSGYPVGSILGRGTLHIQQNVLNTTNGDLWSLGPALPIGPFPSLDLVSTGHRGQYRAAAGGPSHQKRPPGSPGKSGSNSKKPRKENRQSSDKVHNGADDNGDGDGDEAQSDTGSDYDDDDEGDSSRDGPRFPQPQDSPDRKTFKCPFYKWDPARYHKCKGHHITSISYVIQHISRCHVLKQCTMDVQETAKSTSTGDNSAYLRDTTKLEKKIVFYCPACRDEFRGRGADVRFERHLACEAKSIAQTGVLLPAEFDKLKKEVIATSGEDNKWDKICTTLYPGNSTATQHSNAETVTPIGVDVQPHNTIPHPPFVGAVNETHRHDPPQVSGHQMPDHGQLPDPYSDNDGFLYLFQDWHGNMENNIGNLDYTTSQIPNLAPTNETMLGSQPFNPNIIQNPQFPNNTWAQNNYHGTS